jgi:hypothetical protein
MSFNCSTSTINKPVSRADYMSALKSIHSYKKPAMYGGLVLGSVGLGAGLVMSSFAPQFGLLMFVLDIFGKGTLTVEDTVRATRRFIFKAPLISGSIGTFTGGTIGVSMKAAYLGYHILSSKY